MKITMLMGLPASGKTTWAKDHLNKNTIRVNKNELRAMMFNDRQGWHEKLVIAVRNDIIAEALSQNKNVIVDDTNFNPIHEKKIREIADSAGAEMATIGFNTLVEECIKRDLKREKSVGEAVIREMHNKYIRPSLTIEQDPNLPDAVIFDLDGTLALMGDRNPYDASTCEYDKLNHVVYEAMMRYKRDGYKIIICSGRSSKYLVETDRWLGKFGITPDMFCMRKEGDYRKDCVVKKEMFMQNILPQYHVEAVYDDRDQVINMWRDLGLTAFQVADGRF